MIRKKQVNEKEQWFLFRANLRTKTFIIIGISALVIVSILISSLFIGEIPTSFTSANQMPSFAHLFGTDWMGRDMFQRTVAGLGLSLIVGIIVSAIVGVISIKFLLKYVKTHDFAIFAYYRVIIAIVVIVKVIFFS